MMTSMAALLTASMGSLLIQPLASSLVNAINTTEEEGRFLPLLALHLLINSMSGKVVIRARKRLRRARRVYDNMDKNLYFWLIL